MEQRDLSGYKELLRKLEKIYGKATNLAIVQEVLQFLTEEVHTDKLEPAYKAILRSHPTAKGFPDVAALDLAAKRAKERGEDLGRPYHIINWSSSPVLEAPPTEDERRQQLSMKAKAAALGINVEVEGWITSFIMHECARHAREHGFERLPGVKRD